jgi:hypothetical protein
MSPLIKVDVQCTIENDRLVLAGDYWASILNRPSFCVHGVKLRWTCDLCEEYMEKHSNKEAGK